jgi:Polyketide cyclase / dehydrase and lipid transport
MPSWRQQAVLEAPPAAVWELIADPNRFPEWWSSTALEVTGPPTIELGSEFQQTARAPIGRSTITTTYKVEAFDELREVRMRCQQSGWYSHWFLTEARGSTFVDVEVGIDPTALQYRLLFGALGKRPFREAAVEAIDGLREALAADRTRATG